MCPTDSHWDLERRDFGRCVPLSDPESNYGAYQVGVRERRGLGISEGSSRNPQAALSWGRPSHEAW